MHDNNTYKDILCFLSRFLPDYLNIHLEKSFVNMVWIQVVQVFGNDILYMYFLVNEFSSYCNYKTDVFYLLTILIEW